MESWNHIINTALLGTDKKQLVKENLPAEISEGFDWIVRNTESKEDAFLQTAAMLYNFRQCGVLPLHPEGVFISLADKEDKAQAVPLAHQALYDIVETGSVPLLRLWLKQCTSKEQIVQPEAVPLLLDTAIKHKQLQTLIYTCCGNRGVWLSQFNKAWKPAVVLSDEEVWQTGTPEQRRSLLLQIRSTNPVKGRELLAETWAQESAATKAELVKTLSVNAGPDDLPWLEQLLHEKSQKVKDEVIQILKKIPSSSIVQLYWKLIAPSIEKRTEKGLLGFSKKTVIDIFPIKQIDEYIFKTGIEKMSSEQNVSDHNFILYQLVMAVPPAFFENHLQLGRAEILKSLQHSMQSRNFITAFGQAAISFGDIDWLHTVIAANEAQIYIDAISLLPQQEAEKYALKHLDYEANAAAIITALSGFQNEWSPALAKAVLKFMAGKPYQYTKAAYNNIAHLLPVPMVAELEKCTPKDENFRSMWINLSEHITKLLTLKLQTLKAFNE